MGDQMQFEPGKLYFFKKSGNQVRVIAPADPEKGLPCWEVERTAGVSVGKRMIVTERSLAAELD